MTTGPAASRLPSRALRLGLPAWAFAPWRGPYFPKDAPPLASYARVFDTVEGNITFYTLPDGKTVARWCELLTGRDFRFCFKLPREVTHGGMARERGVLAALFDRLEPLGELCGPFMVQLPARIGPDELPALDALLAVLPSGHRFAVEVRNAALIAAPGHLHDLLARHGCGRVLLDTRPIYGTAPPHPDLEDAVHEKPDLPVVWDGPECLRIVRFIGHPLLDHDAPFMREWGEQLRAWLAPAPVHGAPAREVHVMLHCPNDVHAPRIARAMHATLRSALAGVLDMPPLPDWPVPQLGFGF